MTVKTSVVALLARAEFFKGISPSSADTLAGIAIPKTLQKNEILFTEGQKGHSLFLLGTGAVQLFKSSYDGKEVVIKIIQPGEIFGEVVLFEKERYPASARALKRCILYIFSKYQVSCLLENARFRKDFICMLMKKQRYLTERILNLSAYDVEERLLRFLLEQFGKREKYRIELTKKEVASAIGTLPETLSRVLLRMRKKKSLLWNGTGISLEPGFWQKYGDLYD